MTKWVELPIEDTIDLHSFLPKEIKGLVEEYIYQAVQKGYREVRIVHGRGAGVQRNIVQSVLKKSRYVAAYRDVWDRGSTVVVLKTE